MLLQLGLFLAFLALFIYSYVTRDYDRWKKLGIPYLQPSFPFGTFGDWVRKKKNIAVMLREQYEMFAEERVYGSFRMGQPILVVNDPEIAKHVLVKDFNNFVERHDKKTLNSLKGGELDKVFGSQLTWLSGNKWKEVRSTFSPIFTSGKLKNMTNFIKVISENLVNALTKASEDDQNVDLLQVFELFSMDSIASCAFGMDARSFDKMQSMFADHARSFTKTTSKDIFKHLALRIPGASFINSMLKINIHKPTQVKFFTEVIRQAIHHRSETNTRFNDVIDLCIDAMKEKGIERHEDEDKDEQFDKDAELHHPNRMKYFDEKTMLATAMFFISAGAETTGNTLGFAGYYLTKYPEIQSKLQEEVDAAFEESNGEMPNYSVIQSLPYLDQVIHETLRLHPPVAGISRISEEDYVIPNTGIKINKDDIVLINAAGIHHDKKYYPQPEEFNPENFSKEAKEKRGPYTFFSFGQGPRNCIGMRFALLEAKMALLATLRHFNLEKCSQTSEKLELDPISYLGLPKGGLWAKVVRRKL